MKNILICLSLISFSGALMAQCDQHQALIEKMGQALTDKNADLLAEVYHEDAKRHTPEGTEDGLAQIQANARKFYTDVPNAAATNHDLICTSDRIAIRWEGTGTVKENGKTVRITGITIYQIQDGKVIEEWEEMSTLSLMMQLGLELKPSGGE